MTSATLRRLCVLLALLAVACDSTVSPSPSATTSPRASAEPGASASPSPSVGPGPSGGPSPEPGGTAPSTQGLIAADLASGAIDEATSLNYRAWALFDDPRLPERYDASESSGEDNELFQDIASVAPTLPANQRTELERWLLRPTDPDSPLSIGPANTAALPVRIGEPMAAASPAPSLAPTHCGDFALTPFKWYPLDWSPGGSTGSDTGLRVWKCDASAQDALSDQNRVLDVLKKLWGPMTAAMPNGMGDPYPDTSSAQADGNGKVDIYLVEPIAECKPRGNDCARPSSTGVAMAARDDPANCGQRGFPATACSGYLVVSRRRINDPDFADTLAHEFFHRLQQSHNGKAPPTWYAEASAVWAAFHFVGESSSFSSVERAGSRNYAFGKATSFQTIGKSLLYWSPGGTAARPQYQAWTWPLFQAVFDSPKSVFLAWQASEGGRDEADLDAAVDLQLPFVDNFRDFAVWNAQPVAYDLNRSIGLDDVRWQKKPNLSDYPRDFHHLDGVVSTFVVGDQMEPLNVEGLDAWYQRLEVPDDVREIEIDIGGIQNVEYADLDLLLQLNNADDVSNDDKWRRIESADTKVTLCRDQADSNARNVEVVISNINRDRQPGLDKPDPGATLSGSYRITGRLTCRVPDHYSGTIGGSNSRGDSWTGTASFDLVRVPDPRGGCELGTYCYTFVGGSATWTCKSGSTVSVALSPPDNAGGITLYISQPGRPDRDRTYGGAIVASETETCPVPLPEGKAIAAWTVIGWLSIEGTPPKIAADWTLADSYSHTGCGIEGDCGTQSWRWSLQAIFDP